MIQYSRAFLQAARVKAVTFDPPLIADDVWMNVRRRTNRGRRSGVNERARRRRFKPALPSIIMRNVQSLRNKPDELETWVRYLHEFREASLLCLTETWFSDLDPDPHHPGFTLMRCDRSRGATGKTKGGGVCVFVNERWCSNVTVKEQHCCADVELLTVALRPFYLPREFRQIFVTVVYIHPKADVRVAAGVIRRAVQKQETQCPESVRLIAGDFNHCRLNKALPNYRQYVTCKNCGDSTIDLCYGNIPKAYNSRPMPSLGRSVLKLIHLLPLYRQKLKRSKPITRRTRVWSLEATETLNGCFHCTDWDVMLTGASLDEQVETITAYVKFCVDMLIPTKVVKIYPDNKPWVTNGIADVLKRRQEAFRRGSTEDVKRLQKEARKEILQNKKKFRHKVEDSFASNNSKQLWSSLQTVTGYNPNKKSLVADDPRKLAHDLICFYARFDSTDFSAERVVTLTEVNRMEQREVLTEEEASRCFRLVSQRSACGPDEIPGSSIAMTPLPLSLLLCSRGLWNWVTSPPSGSPQLLSLSPRNPPRLPSMTIVPLP